MRNVSGVYLYTYIRGHCERGSLNLEYRNQFMFCGLLSVASVVLVCECEQKYSFVCVLWCCFLYIHGYTCVCVSALCAFWSWSAGALL